MTVQDLIDAMERMAPTRHAEPWDNVGLLCGDPAAELTGVSLCIDLTREVVEEAVAAGASAVIAYHPPIFKDLRRLTPSDPAGMAAFHAVRVGLAVYSPHTALDVAEGGTNDVLADVLGLATRRPLQPVKPAAIFKVVVYVPTGDVETVADTMHEAGAGHIGRYDRCSFRTPGTGTFRGDNTTSPTIGTAGQLEHVDEVRFETVVRAAGARDDPPGRHARS
ncbi:MAG: Nif3-like dinuclear metal center hexameric protein, partial [Planctomycetota bacterium]